MTDLSLLDATSQAQLVRSGQASAVELVDAAIARIESLNPQLNAVIHERFERARTEAAQQLPKGPFRGVPFLVKDALCQTEGDPFHAGMQFLKDRGHVADHDSVLASRYRRAGFVIAGRTNTPELALSATTEPDAYGPTHNPWDLQRSTSGSSGGSAAAVAAGLVPAAHGNDMGGSIRMPAAFCGLVGLKPSYARTTLAPDFGEYWSQMTHEHVLTRSVRDSAAILDETAGPAPGDPYVAPAHFRPWAEEVGAEPASLRIGLRIEMPGGAAPHPECAAAATHTAELLEALGHHVEVSSPAALDTSGGESGWASVFFVHIASELDRIGALYDTVLTENDVEEATWALAALGRQTTAAELVAVQRELHQWTRDIARWWSEDGYDVLVTPQTGVHTPKLGEMVAEPLLQAVCASYTIAFNITGQPAMSVPVHTADDGLPVGTQLVAAYGREDLLFKVASQLETATGWLERRPPVHA